MARSAPRRFLLASALLLACGSPLPGTDALNDFDRDLERIFDPEAQAKGAESLRWSPVGKLLAYVWDDGGGDALWILDAASGASRELLRAREEDAGGDGPSKVGSYSWFPSGEKLLLASDDDLFEVKVASGQVRRLTSTEAEEEDPKLSPDGKRVAFVRDDDLHVMRVDTGGIEALTRDGEKDLVLNGKTDWVYWEEIWGRDSTGHWWSPDGSRLAYYRFEEEKVSTYALIDFSPKYPEVRDQRYPKAGETNPRVRVGVVAARGGKTVWMKTGDPEGNYLARVHWAPDGESLLIERLNREQDRLDLLRCDPASGRCSTVLTETSSTWVRVLDLTKFLPDGRFVWGSDRSGWTHLYLYGADGELIRQLTHGTREVTALEGVDEEAGLVTYTAFPEGLLGAKDRRVERVSLDGGEPEVLTPAEGWHSANVGAAGFWVHGHSAAAAAPSQRVVDARGETVAELPRRYEAEEAHSALPAWEYLTILGPGDVPLPARMLKPAGFDPEKRYPAVVYHYGGPTAQVVVDRWSSRGRGIWHRWMASRGYAVLMVDNEVSTFFGKQGADEVHRRFGEINLAAQLAAVGYLESLGWVDTARLGLWGWSGGGSNTLYCVLNRPGVWKAAVSGAPVTDWHLYDTVWTERYLDHPDDNPDGYRDSSPITHAANLKDHLLVVHGTGDDNVHPQNTLVLSKALIEAGLPFEQAVYPGQKHGFKAKEQNHFYRRMTEFFDRHLR